MLLLRRVKGSENGEPMKQDDKKNKQGGKEKPPTDASAGGELAYFRKPKPHKPMDVGWFYDDEEFFAEHMDEFDW